MTTSWMTLCPILTEQWANVPLRTAKNLKTEQLDAVLRLGQGEAAKLGGGLLGATTDPVLTRFQRRLR